MGLKSALIVYFHLHPGLRTQIKLWLLLCINLLLHHLTIVRRRDHHYCSRLIYDVPLLGPDCPTCHETCRGVDHRICRLQEG